MGCRSCLCRTCCYCGIPLFLVLGMMVGSMFIPAVFKEFEKQVIKNPGVVGVTVHQVLSLYHCDMDGASWAGAPSRTCGATSPLALEGYHDYSFKPTFGGVGTPGQQYLAVRSSHKAWRELVYDPKLMRDPDTIIVINISKIPKKSLEEAWPGTFPIVIQKGTDDPERQARRKLWADTVPALSEIAALPEFAAPRGVKPSDFHDQTAHFKVTAFNMFRQVFGTEVDWDPAYLLKFRDQAFNFAGSTLAYGDGMVGKMARLFVDPAKGTQTMVSMRKELEDLVFPCPAAKQFMQEAEKRGMVGEDRLRELMFSMFFAGLRGTPDLVDSVLKVVMRNPAKFVPLFKADPEAFMLEAARLNPTVGGMLGPTASTTVFHPKSKFQQYLIGGTTFEEKAGMFYAGNIGSSNLDLEVFGGPNKDVAYAKSFIPGRENADRLVTWVAELRDVRKCNTSAGCLTAPRPCPGIHLARRLAKQTVGFFVAGIDAAQGPFSKSEL